MKPFLDLMAPVLICCVCIVAAFRGVDVYEAMVCGAKKGLRVVLVHVPSGEDEATARAYLEKEGVAL